MEVLDWSTADLVFVPQMDEEHQKLFRDMEQAREAIERGTPVDRLGFTVWRLAKTMAVHFKSEEALMRRSHYQAAQWHEHQHQAGRRKLEQLRAAVRTGDEPKTTAAFEELARWMKDHIRLADRMLGAHLRNDGRVRLAS
jgi:hemerythrin-like metal-binding protein